MYKALLFAIGKGPASRNIKLRSNLFHTTRCTQSQRNHNPDSYSKEVDMTPAKDQTVNRLDPDTDAVQRPYEPPSGPWSRAGVMTEEYRHVEGGEGPTRQPYTASGSKGRYGGRKDLAEEKGTETSGPDEGPDAKSSQGRG